MVSPLETALIKRIRKDGPLSVSAYMQACLTDPKYGYYTSREAVIGKSGDFITSPEISQMFGEVFGVALADLWIQAGSPDNVTLIEAGPGKGTLIADILRATRSLPKFHASLHVALIEASPPLKAMQEKALSEFDLPNPVQWVDYPTKIKAQGPVLIIANEFFDALPVDQYVLTKDGWLERRIGVNGEGQLEYINVLSDTAHLTLPQGPSLGAIAEISEHRTNALLALAELLKKQGGAAYIIDYGYTEGWGDTLQGVKNHAFADVLQNCGEVDLSAHVDFYALALTAHKAGLETYGARDQGLTLKTLGIELRAGALKAKATPEQAKDIDVALSRLTAREEMGRLFKVLGLATRPLVPAGFS